MIRSASFVSYTSEEGVEVNEILDSDEESLVLDPTPRPNRTAPASTFAPTYASLRDDDDSDDSDLPDLSQLTYRSIASSSKAPSTRTSSPDIDMESDNQLLSSSLNEPESSISYLRGQGPGPGRAKKSRAKKTPEEAQREKETKQLAKQAAAEQKKLERAAEKSRKEAEKAQQKADKQAHSSINKLVTSKRETLPNMTVEVHPALCNRTSPLHKHIEPLVAKIVEESGTPARMRSDPPWPVAQLNGEERFRGIDNLIRWKRKVVAKYSEEEKEWQAVPEPYYRVEGTYAMYYTLREVGRRFSGSKG
ncbi:hypothetical protein FRB90_003773 [Tulasnella sp. 427]|nr:hypothetical protein FRB90_003773 [Tulasnella sp. 427]